MVHPYPSRWDPGRGRAADPLRGVSSLQAQPGDLCPAPTLQLLRLHPVYRASPALWGGLAEFLYIDPAARLHPSPTMSPPKSGPLSTLWRRGIPGRLSCPISRMGRTSSSSAPVLEGCLPHCGQAAGAGWVGVTGLSHDRDRLELAKRLGADLAIDAEKDVGGAIAEAIGRRPDIVVDVTSDDPEALFTALDLVRSGGRVILASTKGNRAFHFISDVLVAKQLTIRGAMGGLDGRISVGLAPDRHRPPDR